MILVRQGWGSAALIRKTALACVWRRHAGARKLRDDYAPSSHLCLERRRRLERIGAIRSYHARLAPQFLGSRLEVVATIRILDVPEATQSALHHAIASSVHVVAASQLSGAFDCAFHFVCDEAAAWRAFCGELASIGVHGDRLSFGVATDRLATDGR